MKFDALEVAIQLVREAKPLLDAIGRCDARLRDQGLRALTAIPLNLAEGARRLGRDRVYHFSVAAGSAHELDACLRTAEALGYLEASAVGAVAELIDRERAMLWRLSHPR